MNNNGAHNPDFDWANYAFETLMIARSEPTTTIENAERIELVRTLQGKKRRDAFHIKMKARDETRLAQVKDVLQFMHDNYRPRSRRKAQA